MIIWRRMRWEGLEVRVCEVRGVVGVKGGHLGEKDHFDGLRPKGNVLRIKMERQETKWGRELD